MQLKKVLALVPFIATVGANEAALRELYTYLQASDGLLGLYARTFSDGLIDLSSINALGQTKRPQCQSALLDMANEYYDKCTFDGQVNAPDNIYTVHNWIHPLCNNIECTSLSSSWVPGLQEACGEGNQEVLNDGTAITGLTTKFFEDYNLGTSAGASPICQMDPTEDGINCVARFLYNLEQAFIKLTIYHNSLKRCEARCVFDIRKTMCNDANADCFTQFFEYISDHDLSSISPLVARIIGVNSDDEYNVFKQKLAILADNVCNV